MHADNRRCPQCQARIAQSGFYGPAKQFYRAVYTGFKPGAIVAVPGRARCILCNAELPWTVAELTGRAA
jgi:hypothetical protein